MEVGDPLFKVFNDPIFVNWYGDKSFPLLAIGTETMGGFENGLPVYDKNKMRFGFYKIKFSNVPSKF